MYFGGGGDWYPPLPVTKRRQKLAPHLWFRENPNLESRTGQHYCFIIHFNLFATTLSSHPLSLLQVYHCIYRTRMRFHKFNGRFAYLLFEDEQKMWKRKEKQKFFKLISWARAKLWLTLMSNWGLTNLHLGNNNSGLDLHTLEQYTGRRTRPCSYDTTTTHKIIKRI